MIPPLVVLALGVWVISPRFGITGPSLIDDWKAVLSTPAAMRGLGFSYHVSEARFRPAWILWNWAQWRWSSSATPSMFGANLFDVLRLGLLVAGITSFAWLVVPRGGRGRVEQATLCALPALIVVTVPAFAEDLARFGPEEPALVGGMMLGGALLYWGGRELSRDSERSAVRAYSLVVGGFVSWSYGVFQKETSVCVLLFLALAIPMGRGLLRRLTERQIRVGAILTAVALVPVLAMLLQVIHIVRGGSLAYGAHVKAGSGAISVLGDAFRVMHSETHSRWGYLLLAASVTPLVVSVWRRRPDWVQLMILVVAFAWLEMSAQTEIFASRYYLPSVALLAIGTARAVSALPQHLSRGILVVASVTTLISAGGAHANVRSWASGDQLGDDLVAAVRRDTHGGCHLTILGVDPERTEAIGGLVANRKSPVECASVARYLLIGPSTNQSAQAECAGEQPVQIGEWRVGNAEPIQFVRCQ